MENNEIINVQMTKEVFETLGSGNGGEPEYVKLNGERESAAFTPQGLVSLNLEVTENEQSMITSNEYIEVNMPNFTFDIQPNVPATVNVIFKLKKINNNNALVFTGIAIFSLGENQTQAPVMSYMILPRMLSVIFLAA